MASNSSGANAAPSIFPLLLWLTAKDGASRRIEQRGRGALENVTFLILVFTTVNSASGIAISWGSSFTLKSTIHFVGARCRGWQVFLDCTAFIHPFIHSYSFLYVFYAGRGPVSFHLCFSPQRFQSWGMTLLPRRWHIALGENEHSWPTSGSTGGTSGSRARPRQSARTPDSQEPAGTSSRQRSAAAGEGAGPRSSPELGPPDPVT